MKRGRHPLAVAAFLLIVSTLTAQANPLTPKEQAQAFATCAGRLSALATRQSGRHDPASETSYQLVRNFEFLLEAAMPHASEAGIGPDDARYWRAAGWTEIAYLLQQQSSGREAALAARALADIDRRISTCRQLVLPS